MKYSIMSWKLGRSVTFFTGNGTEYVFVDLNGRPGTLGDQICRGGMLRGSPISYRGESKDEFATLCRRWWKTYLRNAGQR